jgi:hypothetical protein
MQKFLARVRVLFAKPVLSLCCIRNARPLHGLDDSHSHKAGRGKTLVARREVNQWHEISRHPETSVCRGEQI